MIPYQVNTFVQGDGIHATHLALAIDVYFNMTKIFYILTYDIIDVGWEVQSGSAHLVSPLVLANRET